MKKKVLFLILGISFVLTLTGCHQHTWVEATCTEPKTCSGCGETEGEALGHTWVDASCEEPEHCSRCDETKGKALGHVWEEATCTEPKTCSRCGEIEGKELGHDWQDATCTEPKTCSRCGETTGTSLGGHKEGKWITTKEATLIVNGTKEKRCSVCGEVLETKSTKKEIAIEGDHFNFFDTELLVYLSMEFLGNYEFDFSNGVESSRSMLYPVYDENDDLVMAMGFYPYGTDEDVQMITFINYDDESDYTAMAFMVYLANMIDSTIDTDSVLSNLIIQEGATAGSMKFLTGYNGQISFLAPAEFDIQSATADELS